jgi:hypothetical protein
MVFPGSARQGQSLRILLVSDDEEFVGRLVARANMRGLPVARAAPGDDLELAAFGHGANVIVLDADRAPRRCARAAATFAGAHPGVMVVLAATTPDASALSGLFTLAKDSAEGLLREVVAAKRGRREAFNF